MSDNYLQLYACQFSEVHIRGRERCELVAKESQVNGWHGSSTIAPERRCTCTAVDERIRRKQGLCSSVNVQSTLGTASLNIFTAAQSAWSRRPALAVELAEAVAEPDDDDDEL